MPSAQVEDLLRRGLDFYALNNADGAARCWEEAAQLDHSDPRALEYLAALRGDGQESSTGTVQENGPTERLERRDLTGLRQVVNELAAPDLGSRAFDKAQFVELLRGKQFETALDVMYQMRGAAPENASVERGIQLLEDRLLTEYVAHFGEPDLIPRRTGVDPSRPGPEQFEVLRLVDGVASLAQVLDASSLSRFATARALNLLLNQGVLSLGPRPRERPSRVVAVETPVAPEADGYDELFRRATTAYLRRDLDTALSLFAQCRQQRPDDRRVQHNIERLEQRKRNP
jgi:hypothetical protein